MSDLIKRIDNAIANMAINSDLLHDCKAKQLLLEAINESLREQNTTLDAKLAELEAEIERLSKSYVPMNNRELNALDYTGSNIAETVQAAVIARYNEQRGVK